jgi:hypothetical protein
MFVTFKQSKAFHTEAAGIFVFNKQNKQTPWPLVRERTIPTDRPFVFNSEPNLYDA